MKEPRRVYWFPTIIFSRLRHPTSATLTTPSPQHDHANALTTDFMRFVRLFCYLFRQCVYLHASSSFDIPFPLVYLLFLTSVICLELVHTVSIVSLTSYIRSSSSSHLLFSLSMDLDSLIDTPTLCSVSLIYSSICRSLSLTPPYFLPLHDACLSSIPFKPLRCVFLSPPISCSPTRL